MENDAKRNDPQSEPTESVNRRLFLKSLGKWSGAAVVAAIGGGILMASSSKAVAGWLNRRGVVRGGWINGGGGGGWINRRVGVGGGWINRW